MAVHPIIDQREIVDDLLIKEVAERIVNSFHPNRIILFGSQARGDARPDSDIDLMVEMETDLDFYSRIPPITEIFGFRKWGMDLIVYTPEEVAKNRDVNGTLIEMVKREGKVLYER